MGRSALAVILGVAAGVVVIFIVEYLSHMVYPPPAGLNMQDPEVLKTLLANASIGALLLVALAWAAGSFAGSWLAARVARQSQLRCALIVGGLLMIAGISEMLMIPHPIWFWVLGTVVFIPVAYLGGRLATRRPA